MLLILILAGCAKEQVSGPEKNMVVPQKDTAPIEIPAQEQTPPCSPPNILSEEGICCIDVNNNLLCDDSESIAEENTAEARSPQQQASGNLPSVILKASPADLFPSKLLSTYVINYDEYYNQKNVILENRISSVQQGVLFDFPVEMIASTEYNTVTKTATHPIAIITILKANSDLQYKQLQEYMHAFMKQPHGITNAKLVFKETKEIDGLETEVQESLSGVQYNYHIDAEIADTLKTAQTNLMVITHIYSVYIPEARTVIQFRISENRLSHDKEDLIRGYLSWLTTGISNEVSVFYRGMDTIIWKEYPGERFVFDADKLKLVQTACAQKEVSGKLQVDFTGEIMVNDYQMDHALYTWPYLLVTETPQKVIKGEGIFPAEITLDDPTRIVQLSFPVEKDTSGSSLQVLLIDEAFYDVTNRFDVDCASEKIEFQENDNMVLDILGQERSINIIDIQGADNKVVFTLDGKRYEISVGQEITAGDIKVNSSGVHDQRVVLIFKRG